jgi:hypothetical protein
MHECINHFLIMDIQMRHIMVIALAVILPGCSLSEYAISLPEESTLAAFPGKGKTQQQFATEKLACEQKAQQMASKARDSKAIKDVTSVAGGMALGSMFGAIGGAGLGMPGATAAGAGLSAGAGGAAAAAGRMMDASSPQGAFDIAFWKCMREAGNTVETPAGAGVNLHGGQYR